MSNPPEQGDLSFEEHQEQMAAWLGAPNVAAMNEMHDALHKALCAWLGIESFALSERFGSSILAGFEEEAVLRLQRFMHHALLPIPVANAKIASLRATLRQIADNPNPNADLARKTLEETEL